jgi:hypothetical protein
MELAGIRRLDTRGIPLDPVADAARTAQAMADTAPPLPILGGGS